MSDKDQFDEAVERLLPCSKNLGCSSDHSRECPAYYRPAVAATLREQGKENATLITQRDWWRSHATDYQAEIADLRAENDELKAKLANMTRIAERNHRANLMPCPNCGYTQAIIHEQGEKP